MGRWWAAVKSLPASQGKKDELIGEYGNNLKIRITALPVENKANKHLKKKITVSSTRVGLLKGENQRANRVKILAPATLPNIIKNNKYIHLKIKWEVDHKLFQLFS